MKTKKKMPSMTPQVVRCSFCNDQGDVNNPLIEGKKGVSSYICTGCVIALNEIVHAHLEKTSDLVGTPTPQDIFKYLDQYIIGQQEAKKAISVAVFNHYKRLLHVTKKRPTDIEIEKSNVLLIGPTGSGKTLIAKTLARRLRVPIAIGDATTLTEAGYVGEDVENLLLRLYQAANNKIEDAERGIVVIDEVDKLRKTGGNVSITRDVGGEGVQQSLLKMLEGTVCNVPPTGGRKHPEQSYIPINTQNILFILSGSFTGLADIIARRLGCGTMGFHNSEETLNKEDTNLLLKQVTDEDLIEFGLIPELIGRLPIIVSLDELNEEQMLNIIIQPKNAIVKQYQMLAELANGSSLIFTDKALKQITKKAMEKGTGARALRSIFESFMTDIMFQLPDQPTGNYVIDENVVEKKQSICNVVKTESAA